MRVTQDRPWPRRLLQRVRLLDGAALPTETAFRLGPAGGAGILGLEAGTIAPGLLADLVAIDLGHPSLDPPTDLLENVVHAMSSQAIVDVWVRGRRVVEAGRLTTTDLEELLARVRALTKGWQL